MNHLESLVKLKFLGPTATNSEPVGLHRASECNIIRSTPEDFTVGNQCPTIRGTICLKDGTGERLLMSVTTQYFSSSWSIFLFPVLVTLLQIRKQT